MEALIIFEQALSGFTEIVYHTKMPFEVSARMMAINCAAQIRVWANENFALNMVESGKKLWSENQIVQSIFHTIAGHVGGEFRKNFSDCCFHAMQSQRLAEAKNKISPLINNVSKKTVLQ